MKLCNFILKSLLFSFLWGICNRLQDCNNKGIPDDNTLIDLSDPSACNCVCDDGWGGVKCDVGKNKKNNCC